MEAYRYVLSWAFMVWKRNNLPVTFYFTLHKSAVERAFFCGQHQIFYQISQVTENKMSKKILGPKWGQFRTLTRRIYE